MNETRGDVCAQAVARSGSPASNERLRRLGRQLLSEVLGRELKLDDVDGAEHGEVAELDALGLVFGEERA
jgi:hypothetical protein